MKNILITAFAAGMLVGRGEAQQSTPSPEAKPVEPVAEAATPERPAQKVIDISISEAGNKSHESLSQSSQLADFINGKRIGVKFPDDVSEDGWFEFIDGRILKSSNGLNVTYTVDSLTVKFDGLPASLVFPEEKIKRGAIIEIRDNTGNNKPISMTVEKIGFAPLTSFTMINSIGRSLSESEQAFVGRWRGFDLRWSEEKFEIIYRKDRTFTYFAQYDDENGELINEKNHGIWKIHGQNLYTMSFPVMSELEEAKKASKTEVESSEEFWRKRGWEPVVLSYKFLNKNSESYLQQMQLTEVAGGVYGDEEAKYEGARIDSFNEKEYQQYNSAEALLKLDESSILSEFLQIIQISADAHYAKVRQASLNITQRDSRITCINNLKQIGIATRIYATDNQDRFPWQVPQSEGGTAELAKPRSDTNALLSSEGKPIFDANAWRHFQALSIELSNPKVLRCPRDEARTRANSFSSSKPRGAAGKDIIHFDKNSVSYWLRTDPEVDGWRPNEVMVVCPHHDGQYNVLFTDSSVQQAGWNRLAQYFKDITNPITIAPQ